MMEILLQRLPHFAGLPLPALRGEVPGYIAWLHAQG